MPDREKVIKGLRHCTAWAGLHECQPKFGPDCPYEDEADCKLALMRDALLVLLKEQEKKQIALHKKHVITWGRNDEFNMRKLYEAICETLLDEGELFIARTDDHEKVEFVFYVAEGR